MSAGDDKYRPAIASSEPSRCEGAVRFWEVTDRGGNRVEVVDYTRDDSAFEVYGASSKGPERGSDEDFIIAKRLNFPEKELNESVFILCDGMGGYGAGDEASRLVGAGLAGYYARFRYHGNSGNSLDAEGALRLAVQATDAELKRDAGLATVRAGSTAVVCVVDEGTGEYTILNIGDSSASLVDDTHNIRITSRHGDDRGRLLHGFSSSADRRILSEDELRSYYESRLLKDPPLLIHKGSLSNGQAIVLSCDGVDEVMPEFPALLGLGVSGDEHNPASRIVQRANDIDGRDNASAIVITGKIMWGGRGKVSQNAAQSARWGLVPETRIDGVEKSPQELMAEARTPEELLAAINGLEGLQGSKKYYNKAELLAAANDIFTGSEVLYFATSTGGFRDAVERVGCRFFPKNMVKGGHREVFTGAHFRGNELKLLDDMIERLGPITGSDGKPIVEEKLKWFARLVVEDGITPSIATRTQGFREALTTMHEDRKKSRR